jgi:phi LC3 family holin
MESNYLKGENKMQSRWKSWPMWLSLMSAVWVIINSLGIAEKFGLDESTFNTVVNSIGSVLIVFGIVNNPTTPDKL